MRFAPLLANLIRNRRHATPHYPAGATVGKIPKNNDKLHNTRCLLNNAHEADVMGSGSNVLGQANIARNENEHRVSGRNAGSFNKV